jgi:hypothetical protein
VQCECACSAVFTSFRDVVLRLSSLTCWPVWTPRLHEFRRRLATAFFFDKATLASSHPERVHFRDVLLRLDHDMFRPTHDTNYHELWAYLALMNLTVDAGYLSDPGSDEERQQFDEAIDVIAAKLNLIQSKITDSGGILISRTETKAMLTMVVERLLFAVRLRPRPKKGVYDDDYFQAEDGVAMQQNYMRRFLDRGLSGNTGS